MTGPDVRAVPEDAGETARLDRVLREDAYRARLAGEVCDLLRLGLRLRAGVRRDLTRRFSRRLGEEAERVEYGLLEVGARGNRTYALLAEVVTAVRWVAKALHALLHLRARIVRYLGDRTDLEGFRLATQASVDWFGTRLTALLDAVREESVSLGVPCPDGAFEEEVLRGEDTRWRLPQDVHAPETVDERERIADIATAFLVLADDVERAGDPPPADDAEGIARYLRESVPLAAAQEARVRMHAIQSTYDTAVAATPLEGDDPTLKTFRGYVSILLHLLETVAYLRQLLARLEEDGRAPAAHARVAALLDPDRLRNECADFGVRNTIACFREARRTATSLLERYTRSRELSLDLPPGRKLHLRPAGLIVRVVQHHGLPVDMRMGEESVDARQLMDVILLAAGNPNATRVVFRGDERTLADLQALFQARLGEDGLDRLPPALAYLLPKA
jgi:phosphotransferase system HPr-like phosphotransfer protein